MSPAVVFKNMTVAVNLQQITFACVAAKSHLSHHRPLSVLIGTIGLSPTRAAVIRPTGSLTNAFLTRTVSYSRQFIP
jgi:hypothetical protein